jgi:hypothetical protein
VRIDTSSVSTINVPSGSNAVIIPDGQQWAIQPGQVGLYYQAQVMGSNPSSSPFGGTVQAAKIVTASGSTLTFIGSQTLGWSPWVAMHSMVNASGDVVLEGGTQNLVGDNTFGGNLTLKAGAQLYNGESWVRRSTSRSGPIPTSRSRAMPIGSSTSPTIRPRSAAPWRQTRLR